MTRLRLAVIGVGHLGKEHARILAGMPDVELVGVVDASAAQAQVVAERLGVPAYTDYHAVLERIDAATVVVPTAYHQDVATTFLQKGIPLLIEKPLASNLLQAETLVELAALHKTVLQVGHIERFNPAFEALVSRPIQPKFIRAERLGSFTGRATDVGVVMDLMIHDLDLLLQMVEAPVRSVEALGVSVFGPHEDVANARLHFANGCVAEVTASRASLQPSRQMQVWAPEGYAHIDFAKKQLRLVQPSTELRELGLARRRPDAAETQQLKDNLTTRYLHSADIDCSQQSKDQLTRELEDFVHAVRTHGTPRVSGEDGLNAIALADRVLRSLRSHRWQGWYEGPTGPVDVPAPRGSLLNPQQTGQAA